MIERIIRLIKLNVQITNDMIFRELNANRPALDVKQSGNTNQLLIEAYPVQDNINNRFVISATVMCSYFSYLQLILLYAQQVVLFAHCFCFTVYFALPQARYVPFFLNILTNFTELNIVYITKFHRNIS